MSRSPRQSKVGRRTVYDGGTIPARTLKDGTPVLSADQLSALELRAANTVLRESELISGAELRFVRKALGLRQTELAEHLGVRPETISRWETGAEAIKRAVRLALMTLVERGTRASRGE
jgi:DNA-binding transcriptional regulator YiaG